MMLADLRGRLTGRLPKVRSDRGATDPILVIAAIAVSLVLLVGGSFAVSGIMTNGKNLNAKSDLDKVNVAEAAYAAAGDMFVPYTAGKAGATSLEDTGVGFRPTAGAKIAVALRGTGWVAISKSTAGPAGPWYVRTSDATAAPQWNAATSTWDASAVASEVATVNASMVKLDPSLNTQAKINTVIAALVTQANS